MRKMDKGSILFILYVVWHSIVAAFISKCESVFFAVVILVGILGIDIYLFFSRYARGKEKEELSELKYNYQELQKKYEESLIREKRYYQIYEHMLDKYSKEKQQ